MSKAKAWLKECFALAFKVPPIKIVWEWLSENVEIPIQLASKFQGGFTPDAWPPGKEILEAAQNIRTRKITMVAAARLGKTFLCELIIIWKVANRPGPILFIDFSADRARWVSLNEIQPLLLACEATKDLIINTRSHWTRKEMLFKNGATIGMLGSKSPGALSGRPAELVIINEADKWGSVVGTEAPPARLAETRLQGFEETGLLMTNSTPTQDYAESWREFKKSTEEYCYLPCIHCGDRQRLTFFPEERFDETGHLALDKKGKKQLTGRIHFEHAKLKSGDYDFEKIEAGVSYECQSCAKLIPYSERDKMLADYKWVSHNHRANRANRGFQMGGLYSPFTSWMAGVLKYLDSKGDMGRMMDFYNSYLGLPFKAVNASLSEKKIKELIAASPVYKRNKLTFVPEIIAAQFDVQDQAEGFWFTIWAWDEQMRMHLLDWGGCNAWGDVEDIVEKRRWKFRGEEYQISDAAIDMQHRSTEVWDFRIAKGDSIYCMQGSDGSRQSSPIRQIDKEWEGITFPFWSFQDHQFKYELYVTRLSARKGRQMFFPQMESSVGAGDGVDSDLINQLTDEVLDKNGKWISKTGALKSKNNHLGDCCKMAIILDRLYHAKLAELAGMKDEEEFVKEQEEAMKEAA